MKKIIVLFFFAILSLTTMSCSILSHKSDGPRDLWKDATYRDDTEIGSGAHTFSFTVEVESKAVHFLVHTDESTIAEALIGCGLISGDQAEYGLYIKTVNGILADYNVNQSYWALYVNDQLSESGISQVAVADGCKIKLKYTK